jgi:two-component system chemotaxis response regulator CheY
MSKKIMIVDDSASLRQMLNFTLSEASYEPLEAANGEEALKILGHEQVDMLITDLNMPVMDGLTLIREVRSKQSYKFIPIIMLTTESQAEKKLEGRSAGATGWIVKPFTPQQLIGVIKKFLE